MYFRALLTAPPLQEPGQLHDTNDCGESVMFSPWTQNRSEIASELPKAQQLPHLAWLSTSTEQPRLLTEYSLGKDETEDAKRDSANAFIPSCRVFTTVVGRSGRGRRCRRPARSSY